MTQYLPPQEQPSQPYPQPPSQPFYQPPQQYPKKSHSTHCNSHRAWMPASLSSGKLKTDKEKDMKRKYIIIAMIILLLSIVLMGGAQQHRAEAHVSTHHHVSARLERARQAASICFLTGLTGPALQENELYCATNALTGVATNCCTSTYQQAIHLAQQKSIVVGTPEFLSTTVDWGGVPVTFVRFNSGFYAWHYNPSNGIATIEDSNNHVVYSGR